MNITIKSFTNKLLDNIALVIAVTIIPIITAFVVLNINLLITYNIETAIVILFSIMLIMIFYRYNKINKFNKNKIYSQEFDILNWFLLLSSFEYKKVLWKVYKRSNSPKPLKISVDGIPLCPKCKTELKQTLSFWWWYIWKCINCDFKIKNKNDFYDEAENVEKVVKGRIENQKPIS